jgi:hypothetical protein
MEIRKDAHQEHAEPSQKTAEETFDAWLDRALEDTFPASDPLASYVFD